MSEIYTDQRLYMSDEEMRQFFASEDAKVTTEVKASTDEWNTEPNPVEHPVHYCKGGIECIDAIRASMSREAFAGYCKGNVLKYLWRYDRKGGKQDLQKAQVYLGWLLEAEA